VRWWCVVVVVVVRVVHQEQGEICVDECRSNFKLHV
jgi:hypothetical protein